LIFSTPFLLAQGTEQPHSPSDTVGLGVIANGSVGLGVGEGVVVCVVVGIKGAGVRDGAGAGAAFPQPETSTRHKITLQKRKTEVILNPRKRIG
jgi:hypothetical protein